MKSLARFNDRAKEIAGGKYHKRVEVDEKDEVGHLARSFNKITAELESKIRDLEASKKLMQDILMKVGTAVTSTRGIKNLLELIIQSLAQGANANSGAIFLIDKSNSELVMEISYGMDKKYDSIRIKPNEGLIGAVVELKKSAIVSNVSQNVAAHFEYKKGLAANSIIVTPLLYKDKPLGAIMVSDKIEQDSFTDDDLILVNNVANQTAIAIENFQLNEDAEKTYFETITALAVAVEAKDPYSRGHLDRVTNYVEKLGRAMNIDEETMKVLKNGATLHDIGKIGIRDDILKKTGPLTKDERQEMMEHVIIGINIIKPIRHMAELCDLVRYHQELYDGTGYPEKLKGDQIPLTARILKICDAYDAMTTDRPYRKAMSAEEAKKELIAKSGKEFDPNIVNIFIRLV
jgi:putative methionine-R-sulfoxide reductase with GAF domain